MQILSLFSQLSHWQIDALAFGMLLMSAVFTIVPEELIFVTLGSLAHYGKISPVEAMLAAQIGLIPADIATVWFGKLLGHQVTTRKPFCYFFAKDSVSRSLEKLRTSGGSVLFIARFLPMLRAPVYLAAGVARFPLRRAALIDTAAAAIQISAFFCLGFAFGEQVRHFIEVFSYAVPVAAVVFLMASAVKALRRQRVAVVAA